MRVRDNIEIPDRMVDAVRRAAAAHPAPLTDLDGLRQRYRRRRRRRVTASAGLAALVVGAAGATAPILAGTGNGIDSSGPTGVLAPSRPAPATSAPAQRLLLGLNGMTMRPDSGPEVGLLPGRAGIPELQPDGRITYHPVSAVDGVHHVVALPDGRLVLTGFVDLTPGVAGRTDGPWVAGLAFKLVIERADGSVELSHDIRVMGETVQLIGATARVAYLLRPQGLVAHEFATGTEQLILPAVSVPQSSPGHGLDIAAGRLAVAGGTPGSCRLRVFDLTRGARVADRPLASLNCFDTGEVRLSPDGTLAAIVYGVASADRIELTETRLAVIDVATGAIRRDDVVSPYDRYAEFQPKFLQGMAWVDGHTLRVAVVDMPARPTRVYRFEEVLTGQVYRIP